MINNFIKKATEKHGNKFDYSNFNYVNCNTKGIIKCNVHNFEFQQTPHRHLNGKGGCLKCQYEGNRQKRAKTLSDFVLQAKSIHNDKYDYSKFIYMSNKTKGIIRCKQCNKEWESRPDTHLFNKSGCPNCNKAQIYTKQYYIANGIKNHKVYFYIAMFSSKDEQFFKIGITKHENVRYRFRGYNNYKIETVTSYETDFFNAYETEQHLLHKYSKYSYKPVQGFSGHTECFLMKIYSQVLNEIMLVLNNRNVISNPSN